MPEENTISDQNQLNTIETLSAEFSQIGIQPGSVLLVHSSLSALGWVCGGAVAVVQALMQVITPEGTLVMPTHSGDLSDPRRWQHPPVPESWWQPIRETMPAYHPSYTPTRGMGKIAEVFRTMPNVIRSNHPTLSFSAWGKHAELITNGHSLAFSLGENSPLARVYDLDGKVLLIGVGFGNNTSFHLSEYRAKNRKTYIEGSPVSIGGERVWQEYDEIDWDDEPFEQIGADFELTGLVKTGQIGKARVKLFHQKQAVDFATNWLDNNTGSRSETN